MLVAPSAPREAGHRHRRHPADMGSEWWLSGAAGPSPPPDRSLLPPICRPADLSFSRSQQLSGARGSAQGRGLTGLPLALGPRCPWPPLLWPSPTELQKPEAAC